MKKPNLLFVFSDQHRWCDLNSYGNKQVISPNFDDFYRKARVFNNCISNIPVCVPMRGSLLTGCLPLKHRAVTNDLPIDPTLKSIANSMNEQGYKTGYIGKWHLDGIPRDKAIKKEYRLGFDTWKVANCTHDYNSSYYYDENNEFHKHDGYEPICQTDLAIDFINNNADVPWGLVLSWGPPHAPYETAPDEYRDIYNDINIELRDNVPQISKVNMDTYVDRSEIREQLRGYYSHISAIDAQFGRLINTLGETNQLENTIIVYTSDHGDMLGSQGQMKKQWYFEESIKVPLMVYWDGKTISGVTDELIGLVDLPISLMSLMGLNLSNNVDGIDLSEVFCNNDAKGLQFCYIMDLIACHQAADRGSIEWRGLKTKKHTYAISALNEKLVLYNNIDDPYQLVNQINNKNYQNTIYRLHAKLEKYISKHDKLLVCDKFVEEFGLKDEWNTSQKHFGYDIIN